MDLQAQYKLGHFYEFAREPYAYDPLLSVQYYTLASSSGEAEADMVRVWFLSLMRQSRLKAIRFF